MSLRIYCAIPEFVIKRSRNMCAMTGLNIQSLAHLGRGLGRGANQEDKLYSRRRIGCQEVKLLSVLRTKITSLFSLPSCPLNFCSSDNDPLPSPPPREGVCCGWSGTLPLPIRGEKRNFLRLIRKIPVKINII